MSDVGSSSAVKYEVLFYKRKNKVHKSKGVGKQDGVLVVFSQSNQIKLLDGSSHQIHSSTSGDIVRRGELKPDDVVSVSQYDVEIIGKIIGTSSAQTTPPTDTVKKSGRVISSPTNQLRAKPKRNLVRRPNKSILVRKTSSKPLWQSRKPPAQPKQSSGGRVLSMLDSGDEESDNGADLGGTENGQKQRQLRMAQCNLRVSKINSNSVTLWHKRKAPPAASSSLLDRTKAAPAKMPRRSIQPTTKSNTNTTTSPPFPGAIGNPVIPQSVRQSLRPHQVEGIAFLWNCLTGVSPALQLSCKEAGIPLRRGVILADQMGLGKTLMTVATIFALHRRNKDRRFIVVCPSSLVSNWAKEFDKWLGRASKPKRVMIKKGGRDGLQQLRSFLPIKPNQPEVLIVSYDLFRINIALLQQAKQIGLLVVDEGHRLKNCAGSQTLSALQSLECEARLLITGTPIQNNLSEFHNVADFCCPGLLGSLAEFRKNYERPINAANNKSASWPQRTMGQAQSAALDKISQSFLLRRLQKDVLKSLLPPRQEFLLFCKPSELQCEMYNDLTEGNRVMSEALLTLTKLRKLCCHPGLLRADAAEQMEVSGKLHVMQQLLLSVREKNPSDKVVVVSIYTSALNVIQKLVFEPNHWTFKRLDGSTDNASRQPLVDSFNRDKSCFGFLLSSKSGGCGLNLVGANRVVMFDADFNPATDHQAMARVYRQGQLKPCYIYRLFTSGTVEEVVYQRQEQKGSLATITVDGASCTTHSSGFTKEELSDCFTLKEGCDCDTKRKMGRRWGDYTGAASLLGSGCTDKALINFCTATSDILRYVHIVTEEESFRLVEDAGKDDVPSNADSDEEAEFETESDEDSGAELQGPKDVKPRRLRKGSKRVASPEEYSSQKGEFSDEEFEFDG